MKLRESPEETHVNGREYGNRLKSFRSKMAQAPKWASEAKKLAEQNDTNDLAFGHESYQVDTLDRTIQRTTVSEVLLPDYLSISKISAIRLPSASPNCIETVEYHPQARSILLTSGMDKNLHIFKTEGTTSESIFCAKFKDLPISASHFNVDGTEIISAGRRPFFYCTDVATEKVIRINGFKGRQEREWSTFCISKCGKFMFFCGQNGFIVVVCAKTKQWISNLKMNENVKAICCSADSKYLFSVGQTNTVYIWDLVTLRCIKRFSDDGGTLGTSIAVSGDLSLLACGSASGIVNVYDLASILSNDSSQPSPLKSYGNITTPISGIDFHPSSQLLSFYSKEKRNALRIAHFPSGRVFTNWPTERSPLGRVSSMSFNSDSSTVAFGSKDGVVQIYNLKHFSNIHN
jgi:U3 small nucleolar RNA-associated protein 18